MATINIRVDDGLKKQSELVFDELGLSITAAMTIFLKAVVRTNSIPFSLEIPNNETLKAFKEVDDISSGKAKARKYSSAADLRKDLRQFIKNKTRHSPGFALLKLIIILLKQLQRLYRR